MKSGYSIATRIKKLCLSQQMSYRRLARLSKIPPSTLMDMISGRNNNPTYGNIIKVATALRCSVRDFFNDDIFDNICVE